MNHRIVQRAACFVSLFLAPSLQGDWSPAIDVIPLQQNSTPSHQVVVDPTGNATIIWTDSLAPAFTSCIVRP